MPSLKRRFLVCLSLCLFLVLTGAPVQGQTGVALSRYFPETGHAVRGGFLDFFNQYGGVPIFGYPITDEFIEKGVTVQYFEKARLEWHPEAAPPNQIALGPLGFLLHGKNDLATPPTAAAGAPDARYFAASGHLVSGPFLSFYDANSGPLLFGLPISEVIVTDKQAIQYFEKARLEQDRATPLVVTPGNVGTEWLAKYPFQSFSLPKDIPGKFFSATGQWVRAAFLDYYERHGGRDVFGEPISGVMQEYCTTVAGGQILCDSSCPAGSVGAFGGGCIPVQYFERARFEWHQELAPGLQVTLGSLGRQLHGPADPPVPNTITPWDPNQRYFPQTGHIVSNAFLTYFDQHGAQTALGFPLSEATGFNGRIVQWFDKARLEWHPEASPLVTVQLGPLGREAYTDVAPVNGPYGPFGKVWSDNPTVANKIGKAVGPQDVLDMSEQYFEGGFMLTWRGSGRIYVVYEGGLWESFPNTWKPTDVYKRDMPVPPDKFEPTGDFGLIWWGLGGPGSKLGWAVDERRDFSGDYQKLERGFMTRIIRKYGNDDDPNQITNKWIYVFYNDFAWQLYQDLWDKSNTVRPPTPTPAPPTPVSP